MNDKQLFLTKIVLFAVYILLIIGIEFAYRNPLFEKSLEWEKNFQDGASNSSDNFFRIITNFGTQPLLIPILAVLYLWFPINKSYAYNSTLFYASFIMNTFKIIYSNPRPYWIDNSLNKDCSSGYGNPSGHASDSIACYLALWHILSQIEFMSKKIVLKILLLVFFLCLVFTIVLSRLYLGVHSVNQIIYGLTIGIAVYFMNFHILKIQDMTGHEFFAFFRNKTYTIISVVLHVCLVIYLLLVYFLVNVDTTEYKEMLDEICPGAFPESQLFNNDGLVKGLMITGLFGMHYGLLFLSYMIDKKFNGKEEEINHWYKGGLIQQLMRMLICALFAIPILLNKFISNDNPLAIVFLFKIIVPFVIGLFNLYGFAIYICVLKKHANPSIYEKLSQTERDIKPSHSYIQPKDRTEIIIQNDKSINPL